MVLREDQDLMGQYLHLLLIAVHSVNAICFSCGVLSLLIHGYFSLVLSVGLCLGKGVSNIVHVGLKNLHVFFMRFSVTA